MEGCVAIYSDLGASFQCLVITSARADSACSDLRPISWKYIVRPRLLTDEAVNKMMCCCCGKPNLCFSFLRRFRSNEPIYLAKNRFQTNLDSKHLFAIVFIPPAFKVDHWRRTWWKQQKYFVSPFRPYIVLFDNLFSTHLISTALTAIWAPDIP